MYAMRRVQALLTCAIALAGCVSADPVVLVPMYVPAAQV